MKILLLFLLTACSTEYHETAANKALRLHNEAVVAQYWKDNGIDPDQTTEKDMTNTGNAKTAEQLGHE